MCENRQWYNCPLSFDVTSNAPTNWLIAPEFASTGRVVVTIPLYASCFVPASCPLIGWPPSPFPHANNFESQPPLQPPPASGGLAPVALSPAPIETAARSAFGCNAPSTPRA